MNPIRCFATLLIGTLVGQAFAVEVPSRTRASTDSKVVVWKITTRAASRTMSQAIRGREKNAAKVLGVLRTLGVKPDEIHTQLPIMTKRLNPTRQDIPSGYTIRRTIIVVQTDVTQFNQFFEHLARLESEDIYVEFEFGRSGPNVSKPKYVDWNVTVVGASNTLLKAKQFHDRRLKPLARLTEAFGIKPEDIRAEDPTMTLRFSPEFPDKKPTGYTFQSTIGFRQRDVERFDELLKQLAQSESEHFHFGFTLHPTPK